MALRTAWIKRSDQGWHRLFCLACRQHSRNRSVITSPYGEVLLLLAERICLALITDAFLPADQARPLPVSISTLLRNRPPDSNSACLVLTSWRTVSCAASGSIRYICGIEPMPALICSQYSWKLPS